MKTKLGLGLAYASSATAFCTTVVAYVGVCTVQICSCSAQMPTGKRALCDRVTDSHIVRSS